MTEDETDKKGDSGGGVVVEAMSPFLSVLIITAKEAKPLVCQIGHTMK